VEAPASGILRDVTAHVGDVVPVGKTIAVIAAAGEAGISAPSGAAAPGGPAGTPSAVEPVRAAPLARRPAQQHGVALTRLHTATGRIEKADVLAYVEAQKTPAGNGAATATPAMAAAAPAARLTAASPKARRLAAERGVDLAGVRGSGPGGAVLAAGGRAAAAPAGPPRPPPPGARPPPRRPPRR